MNENGVIGFFVGLGVALLAATIAVLCYFSWPWNWGSIDPNRQATNITFVKANGVIPGVRYRAAVDPVQLTADAPTCVDGKRDIFNPDSNDTQTGPGKNVTITVGPAYAPHSISLSVPEGKINYVVANVPTQVVFSYAKKVWFYDHTWDDLVDVTADGDKGTIARCMSGLNAGQVARIGLKRVIVYGLQK